MRTRLRRAVGTAGLVLWVAAPVAVSAAVVAADRSDTVVQESAVDVPVQANDQPVQRDVGVALQWQAPAPVLAPAWSGTVTEVNVVPGTVVASGTTVATVDGVARMAWHSGQAFYRPIGDGTVGSDVVALKELLAATTGVRQSTSERVDSATVAGIGKLAEHLGLPAAARTAVFDPTWVLYLPVDGATVAEVALRTADPAPSPGTTVLTFAPRLTAASLVEPRSLSALRSRDEAGEDVAASLTALVLGSGVTADPSTSLTYGGREFLLDEARTGLSPDGLGDLEAMLPVGQIGVAANLMSAPEEGQFVVPVGAVRYDTQGVACVVVGSRRVEVTPVTSTADGAVVTGALSTTDRVVVPAPAVSSCR